MDTLTATVWFMLEHAGQLAKLTGEHLLMSASAVLLATAIGIPLAVLMTRNQALAAAIQNVINTIQTIPAISMLLILMVFLGLGQKTAIAALTLYSLLPIVQNAYAGLIHVDKNLIEAGVGMGMTPLQLLRKVKIPLALPVILTGVRIAAVVAIGTATIATFVGAGGLGEMIMRGIATTDDVKILAGAIPAVLIVIFADLLMGKLEKRANFRLRTSRAQK